MLLISIVLPLYSLQAAPVITNTANASFSINGNSLSLSDSVQFTKDTVVAPTDFINLTKQSNKSSVVIGNTITYTLVVSNPNPRVLTNVSIQDTLPAGIVYQSGSAELNNTSISNSQITSTSNTLNINIGNIPAGTSWNVSYVVSVTNNTAIGSSINKAIAISDTATSSQAQAIVDIEELIIVKPLVLTKSADRSNAKIGDTIRYTLNVENTNDTVVANAILKDTLPAGLSYNVGTAIFNGNAITANTTSGLDFPLGNLAANSSSSLSYDVTVNSLDAGTNVLINQAQITTDNPASNSNTASSSVNVISDDIVISKSVDIARASKNDLVTYTVTVTNPTLRTLQNVTINDQLPTGFIYQSNTAEINTVAISSSDITVNGVNLTIQAGSLAASQSLVLTYQVKVADTAPPGDAINEVQVASDFGNSAVATATVRVRTPSVINFLKIDSSGVLSVLQPSSFNTDQNGGQNFQEINNIPLPNGSVITLPTPQPIRPATEYAEAEPVVIEVIDLDQNTDPTILDTIIVTVQIPGTNDQEILQLIETSANSGVFRGVVLTTTASTTLQDGSLTIRDGVSINVNYRDEEDSTDISATAALVVPDTSLQITKKADKATSSIGELIRYTLEFRNTSGVDLPTLTITDTLPLGFRYVPNTTELNGSRLTNNVNFNGRTLLFNLNNMPAGAVWTIEYITKVSAGAQIGDAINTASFTSGSLRSNTTHAKVEIKDELMRTKNILTGRVYIGCRTKTNDDKIPPKVLSEARIYMETGRSVLTDEEGFWHMEGVNPGAHVLQLDTESISGYEPLLCNDNTRRAKNAESHFVDLQPGSLWHVDFHVKPIEGYVAPESKALEKIKAIDPVKTFGREYLESAKEGFEILWPKPNHVPDVASTKILVKSSPQHRVEVYLNGTKVNPLNYDGSDTNKARTVSIKRWLGVDIDIKNRDNTLLVILKDKSGKEIARKTQNIHFSSNPASAELLKDQSVLIADGKTTPVITLRIKDEEGYPMRANTHGYFTIEDSRYRVKTLNNDTDERNLNESISGDYKYLIEEGGIARIEFNPTTQSGEIKLNLKFANENNFKSNKVSAWLKPALREWIMVGIAEGTLAHKTLSGNMKSLKDLNKSDSFYKRGRVAFFAKGQVKGKYLLTVAYDTHKKNREIGSQLNGNIDPDAYYTIYADNSSSQYDAPSSEKLYLKIEKDNFYALFGDYKTGLSITDLAKYNRTLNGIKTEYQGERFSFKGFASQTSNNHQHDEIPGDGTSGLYRLRAGIIPNSESIRIETRDRFHSDRIVESRELVRYQDYNIDYDSGALFFKFPVTGRDQNLNPNIIVVDYDTEEDSSESITAGGRAAMKSLNGRLETGVSFIHEGNNTTRDNQLIASDLKYDVTPDTELRVEIAQSKTEASEFEKRNAYIIELEKEVEAMEARIYFKKQDSNFGIDSQASEIGTQKTGAQLNYKFNEKTQLNSEVSFEKNLENNNKRDYAQVELKHQHKRVELRAGLRHSRETILDADNSEREVTANTVLLGAQYTTKNDKITLRTDIEKNLSSADESELSPDRLIVGVDVKLKHGFTLFTEQEVTDNGEIRTYNNRTGINKDLWKGAKARTTYTQERTDEGQRNYATLGLSQTIKLNDKLSADFSIDEAITVSGSRKIKSFNADEPERQGTQRDDYTAFSVGLGSNDEDWSWTSRAEYRDGEYEDKLNLLASMIRHYDNGKNLSARFNYYKTNDDSGYVTKKIKLSFGSAWHPKETDFVFFNRLDLINEESTQGNSLNSINAFENGSSSNTSKIVHNMHYNRKINKKTQYSIHHGIKYIEDRNGSTKQTSTVDTGTIEIRRDIGKRWDIGLHGGYLHDWKDNTLDTVAGVSLGVNPMKNAWAEIGYNFEGFDDDDFDKSNFKSQGFYVDFRYKFDQNTLKRKSKDSEQKTVN